MAGEIRWSIKEGLKKKPPRQPTAEQVRFLEEMPVIDEGTVWLAKAYAQLSSEAQHGMGRGPIPWRAMIAWCSYHRMERDVTAHIIEVVRCVDNTMIKRANDEAKAKQNAHRERKGRRR